MCVAAERKIGFDVPQCVGLVRVTGVLQTSNQSRPMSEPLDASVSHLMPEPFESFYEREYRSVVGLAYILCGDRWAAEELTQDAMIEAHSRWGQIGHYEDPGAWVRRVLANKSTSRFRRLTSETKAMTKIGSRRQVGPSVDAETEEMFALVRRLPPRQAQAVALRFWEDRPVKEIALILECGTETVKTHLKRGLKKLESLMEGEVAR